MADSIALSIKQPWATLVAHGLKTIEIRRWETSQRGRVYIHAARAADDRDYGWKLVPKFLLAKTSMAGGIIGVAELTDCVTYESVETFEADRIFHLNEPSWYSPPCMFGFKFANAQFVPFRKMRGYVRFFSIAERPTPMINGGLFPE
jgi:hypothetical protein